MTAAEFRAIVLSFPEVVESAHMDHPDFRVRKKIFATLGPDEDWAMVKLTPEQQAVFLGSEPKVFTPVSGAWGRRGCTMVKLEYAHESSVRQAAELAWRGLAPKKVALEHDSEQ